MPQHKRTPVRIGTLWGLLMIFISRNATVRGISRIQDSLDGKMGTITSHICWPSPPFANCGIYRNLKGSGNDLVHQTGPKKTNVGYFRSMGPDHPKSMDSMIRAGLFLKNPAVEAPLSLRWAMLSPRLESTWETSASGCPGNERDAVPDRCICAGCKCPASAGFGSSKGSSYTGRWLGRGLNCNKSTLSICGARTWGFKSNSFVGIQVYLGARGVHIPYGILRWL